MNLPPPKVNLFPAKALLVFCSHSGRREEPSCYFPAPEAYAPSQVVDIVR